MPARRRVSRRQPVRRRRAVAKRPAKRRRTVTRRAPARRRRAPAKSWLGSARSAIGTVSRVVGLASAWLPPPYNLAAKTASALGGIVSGRGDYNVSGTLMHGSVPRIRNNSRSGGTVIRHCEYITDIATGAGTPTNFNNNVFALNPGDPTTFPWLSTIAQNFEEYEFKGILFEYKTLSVDAIASSTVNVGAVIMATDYNVSHPPFVSKNAMENYEFAVSAKPSVSMLHMVETKRSQTPVSTLYVRGENVPNGQDARLYDLGLFQIATQGLPAAASSIGELWVTYEVEFFKPSIPSSTITSTEQAHWLNAPDGASTWSTFTLGSLGYSTNGQPYATTIPKLDAAVPSSIVGPTVPSYFANYSSGILSTNVSTTWPGNPQSGQVGLIVPSSGGAVNTIYFMNDSVPHLYYCVINQSATAAATLTATGVTRYGPGASSNVPATLFSASSNTQVPPIGTSTQYVVSEFFIGTPATGTSGNSNATFASITQTYAAVPVTVDFFVVRLS